MPKPARTRYRRKNWSSFNRTLEHCGSLALRFDPGMAWRASPSAKRDPPEKFSDCAIQLRLTLKVLSGLLLCRTAGLVESLMRMAGLEWSVPDYSTLCRRQGRIRTCGRRQS